MPFAELCNIFEIHKKQVTNMDYVSMGRRIRRARKSLGLTQNELANRLGITTSYLGHIELGKRKASMEIIINIANELRVSMDFLECVSKRESCKFEWIFLENQG